MRLRLADLATALGLSTSTVSRALKNDARISETVRQRVQRQARESRYRPDPLVSALMTSRRTGQVHSGGSVLAWIHFPPLPRPDHRQADRFSRRVFNGAQDRAAAQGFALEVFTTERQPAALDALERVLATRAIRGAILGLSQGGALDHSGRFSSLALAAVGNEDARLPQASTDHLHDMVRVMDELAACGYRRPALALTSKVRPAVRERWEAGYCLRCFQSFRQKPLILPMTEVEPCAAALKKIQSSRIDAVISETLATWEWMKGAGLFAAERPLGFATLAASLREPQFSGILQEAERIGAAISDLVIAQIFRNEFGQREHPKRLVFSGRWIEGSTVRR